MLDGGGQLLPVELASFTGIRQTSSVLLKWTTAQELNNDRFEVQRSAEGRDYQTIGTVQGKGTTSVATSYSFADAQPLSGSNYYRLRQVDFDGSVHYSPVVVVQGGKRQVLLTPNPAVSQLDVRFSGEAVQWRILNPVGQVLRKGAIAANATLNVSDLRPGAYFFEATADGQRSVQRFIKAE
ncbi:T9SS type A sorting domain-containing protein [Hymenobacter sp. CRA2]|uniref:T9SS type A sorting domain-containing protein n=1 Tax=Hymenobacter sp. CRA2 TaxID=1955620 RepID=UPI0009D4A1A6|nr:T9SS type A sorting domain-containing protein [Hymenobacter sp. CRA2]OON68617.1 hypothetical protein B0919_13340 [Hymenobacter sp. CRA2]